MSKSHCVRWLTSLCWLSRHDHGRIDHIMSRHISTGYFKCTFFFIYLKERWLFVCDVYILYLNVLPLSVIKWNQITVYGWWSCVPPAGAYVAGNHCYIEKVNDKYIYQVCLKLFHEQQLCSFLPLVARRPHACASIQPGVQVKWNFYLYCIFSNKNSEYNTKAHPRLCKTQLDKKNNAVITTLNLFRILSS